MLRTGARGRISSLLHTGAQNEPASEAGAPPNRRNPSHWFRWRRSTWANARCAMRAHYGQADPRSWHRGDAMKQQIKFASDYGSEVIFPALNGGPPSKAGWADTFEEIARRLGQDTRSPQGLRLFTGHSARASGAVHLAHTQVELWRIQLFGRWGSDCFKQYVRDAPLSQLHGLAQEASLHPSLAAARAELAQLLQACEDAKRATSSIASQPVQCFLDCKAANAVAPLPTPATTRYVVNQDPKGKVHLAARVSDDIPHYLWRTKCHWPFAHRSADYTIVEQAPDRPRCAKCFKPIPNMSEESSSSSSSGSEEP